MANITNTSLTLFIFRSKPHIVRGNFVLQHELDFKAGVCNSNVNHCISEPDLFLRLR